MKDSTKPGPSGAAGPSKSASSEILNDPRFAHLVSDPRFKNIHKSTKSVKIDNRFKSMFQDDKFKVKYTTDKYGRRVNKSSTDDLEKYYHLSSDEDEEAEKRKEEEQLVKEAAAGIGDENDVLQSDEEISGEVKDKLKDLTVDYARGEGALWSDGDSSDDESSADEDGQEIFIEHVWGELDNDAPRTEESTRRLAVCNMVSFFDINNHQLDSRLFLMDILLSYLSRIGTECVQQILWCCVIHFYHQEERFCG